MNQPRHAHGLAARQGLDSEGIHDKVVQSNRQHDSSKIRKISAQR